MTKERKQMLIQGLECSGLSAGSYIRLFYLILIPFYK